MREFLEDVGLAIGALITALILCALVVLAGGCRPLYVQQPPPVVLDGTGGAPAAACEWLPSKRVQAKSALQSRITGGDQAPTGAYPWACALERDGWQYCACTLIGPRACVTAAHCQAAVDDIAHCAANDLRERGVQSRVLQARNHPDWSGTASGSDVAVLVLDARVDGVPFVALPDDDVANQPAMLTAIGWGAEVADGPTTDVQRYVEIPVVPRAACMRYYDLTPDMLCAGDPGHGQDTCQGDSGGPLAWFGPDGPVLDGVTSWGARCATAPGVYTDVYYWRTWIESCSEGYR